MEAGGRGWEGETGGGGWEVEAGRWRLEVKIRCRDPAIGV